MYKSEIYHDSGIYAKVVEDSIANGVPLTTLEVRFHRFILPEFNTHRMFSRNFSSSRAIPVAKMIEQVQNDPAMPVHWGKNITGMQAKEECDKLVQLGVNNKAFFSREDAWDESAAAQIYYAERFAEADYHKQIVNRLIEPFQFVKGVVTATEFDNFFALRDHEAAQPEIQVLARCMKQAMEESIPTELQHGEFHLPYITEKEYEVLNRNIVGEYRNLVRASVARCARVSYMKHDNTSPSMDDDLELYNQLVTRPYTDKRGFYYPEGDPIHGSPLEHCATPMSKDSLCFGPVSVNLWDEGTTHIDKNGNLWSGNFKNWIQYRQLV